MGSFEALAIVVVFVLAAVVVTMLAKPGDDSRTACISATRSRSNAASADLRARGEIHAQTIATALTGALDWRRHMKIIVDEAGEIIAKATDDHTLIGGHHRLAVAASLGKRLFWRDTGEPVKLDLFFKHHGSSLRHTA